MSNAGNPGFDIKPRFHSGQEIGWMFCVICTFCSLEVKQDCHTFDHEAICCFLLLYNFEIHIVMIKFDTQNLWKTKHQLSAPGFPTLFGNPVIGQKVPFLKTIDQ